MDRSGFMLSLAAESRSKHLGQSGGGGTILQNYVCKLLEHTRSSQCVCVQTCSTAQVFPLLQGYTTFCFTYKLYATKHLLISCLYWAFVSAKRMANVRKILALTRRKQTMLKSSYYSACATFQLAPSSPWNEGLMTPPA